jgi:hypothetical protein
MHAHARLLELGIGSRSRRFDEQADHLLVAFLVFTLPLRRYATLRHSLRPHITAQ